MVGQAGPVPAEVFLDGVDPRVRIFRAAHEVDTAVVVTDRYVVVVDTMATPDLMASILARMDDALAGRRLLVVNTHADWDHAWGNALFDVAGGRYPAPIIGHDETRRRLQSAEEGAYLRERQQAEPRFASVRLVAPSVTFTEGLRIDGGDLTLELLPTPGHTPDHVSIWIPELRLALARLAGLDPSAVIPCHGGTADPALLARNLAYVDLLEARARAALAAGRVSANWAERADLPALVGLPFAEVAPDMTDEPPDVVAFYQESHLRAIHATLINLGAVG